MSLNYLKNNQIKNIFEKKAIKDGLIPEKTGNNIISLLNEKKSLATGNLLIDYEILIKELKNKGLFSQAESISKAVEIYKNAENHLYNVFGEEGKDILNFAHPDGSVEILPAKNREGEVETLENAQEKTLSIVYKQPTGKYSEEIKSSIFSVANALGIDLLKFAQDIDSQENIEFELLSDDSKKKITEANQQIQSTLANNAANLEEASNATGILADGTLADWLKFSEEKILNGSGLFFYLKTLKEKNSLAEYQKFRVAYSNLSRGNPITAENISNLIYSLKTYEAMLAFFNAVDPIIGNEYFLGSVIIGVESYFFDDNKKINEIKEKSVTDSKYKSNPNSVWTLSFKFLDGGITQTPKLSLNSAAVGKVANYIFNWINEWKSWFITKDKINNANETVIKTFMPLKNSIEGIKSNLEPGKFLSYNKILKTTGNAIGALQSINENTDKVIKDLNSFGTIYNELQVATVPESITNILNRSKMNIDKLWKKLSKIELNPILDNPIENSIKDNIVSNFRQIAIVWNNFLKNSELSDDDKAIVTSNIRQAIAVSNVVSKNADKPYAFILSQISAWFPKAQTPEQLSKIGIDGLQYVKSVVPARFHSTAQLKNDLIKSADFGALKGKPISNTSSSGAGKQNVSSQTAGMKKFDQNDPAQVAVAKMQLSLNILGRLISVEENKSKFSKLQNYDSNDGLKIIGTGPKSNPHLNMFDGIWGPNTNQALTLAQKYVGSLGGSLNLGNKWNQSTRSHSAETKEQAQKNTVLLNKVNSFISGQKFQTNEESREFSDSTIFDKIPKQLNWNLDAGPSQASFDKAEINVTKGNLSSLKDFYDFLISSGLRQPETTGSSDMSIGEEGFTPKTWNQSLQWFIKRAVLKYNSMKSEGKEALENAKNYYNNMNNLWQTYRRMISLYLKSGKIKTDQVINDNLILEFSNRKGPSNSLSKKKNDESYSQQESYEEFAAFMPEDSNQQNYDGTKLRRVEAPKTTLPFSDVINLRDEDLWADLDRSQLSAPILRLSDFQKVPGPRMAQFLFAASANQIEAQRLAIINLGRNPIRWDQNLNEWIVSGSKDKKVVLPASKVLDRKQIQTLAQQYIASAPLIQYQQFLGNLSTKLGRVLQEWSEEAPEQLIVHIQDYYKYWQQAIAKQIRDLQRIRS